MPSDSAVNLRAALLNTAAKTPEEKLDAQLALAGIDPDEMKRHWRQCIIDHRSKGQCSSINFSTVEFIPLISKLLDALGKTGKS